MLGSRAMKMPDLVVQRRHFWTIIVGSCTLFREGLAQILDHAGFRIIASRPSVADLPDGHRSPPKPVLLIVDAGSDPNLAIREIELFKKRNQLEARIAVMADCVKLDDAISAFRAGASAYLVKNSTGDMFVKFLDLVMRGETILLAGLLSSTVDLDDDQDDTPPPIKTTGNSVLLLDTDSTGTPELSAREKCILQCLIMGDSNKAIARKINIAEATVKVHIKAILRKIRVQNRTQAAIWAVNHASFVQSGENAVIVPVNEPSGR
jgi:two-component system nitrate/nitrite response regulator NarL